MIFLIGCLLFIVSAGVLLAKEYLVDFSERVLKIFFVVGVVGVLLTIFSVTLWLLPLIARTMP